MLAAFLGTGHAAGAQDGIRTEQVRFAAGENRTTIEGAITGYESVSYRVGAEAGQRMKVALDPSNGATYFNVYAPGSGPGDAALAIGSTTGGMMRDLNRFAGVLPTSGEYTINVYMLRAAARRNERSDYDLAISIRPQAGPVVKGDFADGLQGGPDYWAVTGLTAGDTLNLRADPTTGASVLRRLAEGAALRNLGCRMAEGHRWCNVETVGDRATRGWVAGAYLAEGNGRESAKASSREPVPRGERVSFPSGSTRIVLGGRLNSGDAVNYLLGARKGQVLSVSMLPDDLDTHFNIFAPDGGTIFESIRGGNDRNRYRGRLPESGDTTVTVYHLGPRAAAYRIEFVIE